DGVYKTISVSTRAAGWASGKVADLPMEYAPSETVYGAGIIGAERLAGRLERIDAARAELAAAEALLSVNTLTDSRFREIEAADSA
ncbi:hypothetical protein H7H37_26395, partial [Mycolicibacterium insubricum]|nr:hypothetical protein [Mycolicibacterium insubricum]